MSSDTTLGDFVSGGHWSWCSPVTSTKIRPDKPLDISQETAGLYGKRDRGLDNDPDAPQLIAAEIKRGAKPKRTRPVSFQENCFLIAGFRRSSSAGQSCPWHPL